MGSDSTTFFPPGSEDSPSRSETAAGEVFGHYELQARIGSGGMGSIYRARDSRLDRIVAIKVLRADLAQFGDLRQRFEREARTVAKLNHPHICTLYDIGRNRDTDYLVLEYLHGETLESLLEKGPLSTAQILRYAIDTADALDQAHRQGFTHRDIKPSNIMITQDGWLKVLDFGLAKLAEETRQPSSAQEQIADPLITQHNSLMGTLAYMSPEQVSAEDVDVRSDIFSFGAVLYEMAGGRRPFERDNAKGTMNAILRDEPKPLHEINAGVPPELERIISGCLRKDRTLRFQTMTEIKAALEEFLRKTASVRSGETPSLAVLPFADPSGDQQNEYFGDGLTEEIINAVAQVKDLRSVSRSSVFQFKGTKLGVQEVGRRLQVDSVLEGTVRRSGNRLRITAQLINVEDGSLMWSERFERTMEDIFEVQDELTRAIVLALKPRIMTPVQPVQGTHVVSLEAHELYLKGKYSWNLQSPEGVSNARSYFEQVVACHPKHAGAHVGLADCYLLLSWYGLIPADQAVQQARMASLTALELDETLPLAHCALAIVQAGYEWNWTQAAERFNRALELGPGFSTIHFHYALDYLTPIGRLDEALREIQRAQELDPLSLITRTALGGCFYRQHQYDAAIKQFQNTLEADPNFYHAHWSLARALEGKYLYEEAVQEFRRADELCSGDNTLILGELGHCYGLMSQDSKALEILEGMEKKARETYVSPLSTAFISLGLGRKDETFRQLELALEQRARSLVWVHVDPRFESLRSDERFSQLVKRMGLSVVPGQEVS